MGADFFLKIIAYIIAHGTDTTFIFGLLSTSQRTDIFLITCFSMNASIVRIC